MIHACKDMTHARRQGSMKMELSEVRPEERTPLVESLLGVIRRGIRRSFPTSYLRKPKSTLT
jgi:hypothetical protein